MAQFQQRHYNTIARALESVPDDPTKARAIDNLVLVFGQDNPKFKATKFKDACYGRLPELEPAQPDQAEAPADPT